MFIDYQVALTVALLMAILLLAQLLIADVVSLQRKHPPGVMVQQDHQSLLFRVSRTFANTNETIAIFILLLVTGVLLQANATWLNVGALLYFCARVAHMLCYYCGWALARTVVFVFSLLGLFTMLAAGIAQLWF